MRRYTVAITVEYDESDVTKEYELHDVSWAQLQELIPIFHASGAKWEVHNEGEE